MQKASFRRIVLLFLLLVVLAAPWASAAGRLDGARPLDLVGRFWTFLTSAWSETGPSLDPDGAPARQRDEGPQLDPNGARAPQSDEGSHLDPDG